MNRENVKLSPRKDLPVFFTLMISPHTPVDSPGRAVLIASMALSLNWNAPNFLLAFHKTPEYVLSNKARDELVEFAFPPKSPALQHVHLERLMADEWKAPFAVAPLRALTLLAPLLMMVFLLGVGAQHVVAQNAAARKDFVKRLGQSTILTMKGTDLVPKYRLSVEGPDSSFFVYHASLMNPSICSSLLTDGVVNKFRALGFTKLVCTDDGDDTFTLDPVVQTVPPAAARKDYVEMLRRSVIKRLGVHTPSGYNVSTDGPDATFYVHHQLAV